MFDHKIAPPARLIRRIVSELDPEKDQIKWRLTIGLIFAIGALSFIAYCFIPTQRPYLTNDSLGYMTFALNRTIGYPAFLDLVKSISGSYQSIGIIQLIIYFVFVVFLCIAFMIRFGNPLLAIGLEFLLVANPGPVGLANQITADSLSTSLGMGYVGLLLILSKFRSFALYFWLIAIVTALALIRPINLLLFLPILLSVIYYANEIHQRWLAVFAIAVGLTISLEATPVTQYFIRGSFATSSPVIPGLFHDILFRPELIATASDCPDAEFIKDASTSANNYIDRAPSEYRPRLQRLFSEYLRFYVIIPTLMKRHEFADEVQTYDILKCYVSYYVRENLLAFVAGSVTEYFRLITNSTFIDSNARERYQQYIKDNNPVLPLSEAPEKLSIDGFTFFSISRSYPQALSYLLSGFYILSFLIFCIAVFHATASALFGSPRREVWLLIGLLGLGVQSKLWATMVIEMAQPRYIFPEWGAMCVMSILAILAWLQRLPKASSLGHVDGFD